MPIKQDTHIEKHLLQDSNVMNEIQDIVFGLLNEGGMELRVLTSASNSRFRFFCTPDGDEFFNRLSACSACRNAVCVNWMVWCVNLEVIGIELSKCRGIPYVSF